MRITRFIRIAAVLLCAALLAVPTFAARGNADFTTVVALGDSLMAGFEAGSLNTNHQDYSPAAIFARQVQTKDFQQPLISFPGVTPELMLLDIAHFPPSFAFASGQGVPLNINLPRPYNNLAVPGANTVHLISVKGTDVPLTTNPYFQIILRTLGSQSDQAIALKPTFILLDIGNNDFLGAATNGNPALLTSSADFKTAYNALLDKLINGAPNAGMVVANLPVNFLQAPRFSTVPPFILNPATNQPILDPTGKPIYYVTISGGKPVQLGPGSFVSLDALSLIQQGYGFPAALKPLVPLPHVGEPLPDSVTLTADEATTITNAVKDFNTTITAAAAARNIPVADVSGEFDQLVHGLTIGPFTFTPAFISGGIFSMDAIHPTEIGYTLLANTFIKATNAAYNMEIPVASIASLMQNNDTIVKMQSGAPYTPATGFTMSTEGAAALHNEFAPITLRMHLHAAHH